MTAITEPGFCATTNETRTPPRVALAVGEGTALTVTLSGDFDRINAAARSLTVAEGLTGQLATLGSPARRFDDAASNFALGFVDAMDPRDPAEALLAAQMAAIHQATLAMATRLNRAETPQQREAAERALNKLARTFAAQMDTLKQYRSKGHQLVRVERVTVEPGGQAIVGAVETGGRGRAET